MRVALFTAACLLAGRGHAADHGDGATPPAADIADVFAWMATDGSKVNLVLTVSPADTGGAFGPGVGYVFHVTSKAVPTDGGTETRVICTFSAPTDAACWVVGPSGVKDHVAGDPSNPAGTASSSGKVRLFAGRRSDPAFANVAGFQAAAASLRGRSLPENGARCPALDTSAAGELRTTLATASSSATAGCPANQLDCHLAQDVLGLVLQVDKSLLNAQANTLLSVWGATHEMP